MKETVGSFLEKQNNKEFVDKIWSDKNEYSPYEVLKGSSKRIWLKCLNDSTHPDYDLIALNIKNSYACPYCSGRRVCYTNSFGYLYPEYIDYWSDKNDKSPFECRPQSHDRYWFKCENGIHDDYRKKLYNQVNDKHMCPDCALIERIKNTPRGENSPYWKGDTVNQNRRARDSYQYDNWRKAVFAKDNYTCQCCGQFSGELNAHHIKSFAHFEELRYSVQNGMTLCGNCHSSNIYGSFHNIFGTRNNTPEQLEEYINMKRLQLGIPLPFSLESYLSGTKLKPGDVDVYKYGRWIFDKYSIDELQKSNRSA